MGKLVRRAFISKDVYAARLPASEYLASFLSLSAEMDLVMTGDVVELPEDFVYDPVGMVVIGEGTVTDTSDEQWVSLDFLVQQPLELSSGPRVPIRTLQVIVGGWVGALDVEPARIGARSHESRIEETLFINDRRCRAREEARSRTHRILRVTYPLNSYDFVDRNILRNLIRSPFFETLWEEHQNRQVVDGVVWQDDAVPMSLRSTLNDAIDRLAGDEPADYHPGTDRKIRDLVHPSLYPYIRGVTQLLPGVPQYLGQRAAHPGSFYRSSEDSIYQWLPSMFDVDEEGGVRITSYINNLNRDRYRDLYCQLEMLFMIFLPEFEKVYSYTSAIEFYNPEIDNLADSPPYEYEPERRSLRGKQLQVITKIVDYELAEGGDFEGVWHVDGMSHENIVCTGLYIVDRDHAISGGDLLFKRAFYSHEAVEIFMGVTRDRPVITDRVIASGLLPLGRLATDSGRMIVYPNSHVHKVSRMVNQGNTVAKSRIVIFFLVDPGLRMLCTLDVAPQQLIVSREEAEMHRLSLMEERKNHKQDWNIREIELCEH